MRSLLALVLAVVGLTMVAPAARAGCDRVEQVELVQGAAQVNTQVVCSGGGEGSVAESIGLPVRDSDLDALCVNAAISNDVDPFLYCPEQVDGAEPEPELTPGMIAAAFQRLPLPAADLVVQPPNGRTLVNFETNFYTEQGEFTRTVTLLGRRVELRIWPERFGWEFGDGHERWTTSPGDAYPNLEVTHRYLSKGRVTPSVATMYAAQFRVGNGPWRDVSGTVTIPGAAQSLRVVEARPVLVGGS